MNKTFIGALALAFVVIAGQTSGAFAYDRHVRIYNDSSYTIKEFYASNSGTKDWEEDILGKDVLYSGQSVMVNINDGTGYCQFDFLAVFEDGDQAQSDGAVNVCETSDFHFTD